MAPKRCTAVCLGFRVHHTSSATLASPTRAADKPTQAAAHANATHIKPAEWCHAAELMLCWCAASSPLIWSSDVVQAKEAVTGASFNGFDVASLQHNVRFGDLQSITGAQVPPTSPMLFT